MQYQPSASELLSAIADLLEDELLPALPDALKHKCRVAANLARILERQERLGPEAAARERDGLAALLGHGEAGPASDGGAASAGDASAGDTEGQRSSRGGASDVAGERGQGRDDHAGEADVAALSAELVRRITTDDDAGFQQRAWDTLVAVARDDLAIAKPGHDAWEGG